MRLNMATRRSHVDVDEPWLDLLRPTVSRADYLNVLVRAYGFVGPFEAACKYTPDLGRIPLVQRPRAGLIAQDLLALGLRPAQVATLPQCHSIMTFRGVAEALGWLYVVERSVLLHDGVRQHLQRQLPGLKHAYLSMHEGRVGEHWSTFGCLIDRVGAKPEVANEVIKAAHAGFEAMRKWFQVPRSQAMSAG